MEVDEKQLFSTSKLPPVQLPLDYSLHARHRTVAPKQIKGKSEKSQFIYLQVFVVMVSWGLVSGGSNERINAKCSQFTRYFILFSVKKEVSDLGDTATPAPVKLVKPVLESTANQTQPKRTTAAQLFTPSEVSYYITSL